MWANARTLRIVDGPDEVHLQQLARRENKTRKDELAAKLRWQAERADQLLLANGFEAKSKI